MAPYVTPYHHDHCTRCSREGAHSESDLLRTASGGEITEGPDALPQRPHSGRETGGGGERTRTEGPGAGGEEGARAGGEGGTEEGAGAAGTGATGGAAGVDGGAGQVRKKGLKGKFPYR